MFGLFKRGEQMSMGIMPDCSKVTLKASIHGKIAPALAVHSDG